MSETKKNEINQEKKTNNKKKNEKKEEELSEEDLRKKEELELLVERIQDPEIGVQKLALDTLISEIKSSTSSMTSVPKPLKFLKPYYDKIKEFFSKMKDNENKTKLSDILSVLGMTMAPPDSRECLQFKLTGSIENLGSWGHEYVRHLSGEIGQEYNQRITMDKPVNDLMKLVDEIIPFNMKHNAEHEACDLLLEVEKIEKILSYIDENNYSRVCLYLSSTANYIPEPEDNQLRKIIYQIYQKMKKWPEALKMAMLMNDIQLIRETFISCEDSPLKKQLAFMLARQHISLGENDEGNYSNIISNSMLSDNFIALAQDLDIIEAKTPEDVFKSNLNETRGFSSNVDSARQNLASTYVNAFVNAGFGNDKLMTEEGNKWLYKNKEHGMMSAAASLGMILLWNVDGGLSQIDKFLYANENYIKAGALLAVGIVNCGVRNECDPAFALLSEYIENQDNLMKIGAILGLGLAYAGSSRQDLLDILMPILENTNTNIEVLSITALSLGLIFVGSANSEITQSICQTLMEKDGTSLNNSHCYLLCLGLGLLYLCKGQICDVTLETLKIIEHPIGKYASLTVETCAYAGSGNVLKVQKLLDICGDHLEDKNIHQSVAVLGIALISMGEEIGLDMAIRSFDHLLQYGEQVVRRAVPLALGLISISNPRINIMDTLSKLSHDHDEEVSMGAIFSLGLIGAGTNNSRVANILRGLASYYYKEANHLFMVKIAQGLVYLGKGTLSLAPYHADRTLLSHVSMAGLLAVLHSCFDLKNIILKSSHYLLYCLVTAMYPRMLMTFNENLKPLPVLVRVGQAVDTIGQAGRPKTITGFQTHTTPVLLGYGDRAELATEEYISLTPILEGFVILKSNPNAPPKEK